jgi:hypothetical protein
MISPVYPDAARDDLEGARPPGSVVDRGFNAVVGVPAQSASRVDCAETGEIMEALERRGSPPYVTNCAAHLGANSASDNLVALQL